MASAAVNMCFLPSDTAFRSGASSAALKRFWVSFGRGACAFLRILVPEGEKGNNGTAPKAKTYRHAHPAYGILGTRRNGILNLRVLI